MTSMWAVPDRQRACGGIPVYEDFTQMMKEVKPDVVIVTTVDVFHSDYIIQAMEMGRTSSPKALTITADRCRAILEAEQRTGKKGHCPFNYRYAPFATKVKELISSGAIGDVLVYTSVDAGPGGVRRPRHQLLPTVGTPVWPRAAACWSTSPPTTLT